MVHKYITAISLMISTVAYAQDAKQEPVKQPTEYTLKVTPSELDLISEGLQSQSFGKVFQLINKLRQQIFDQQRQLQSSQQPAKPDK